MSQTGSAPGSTTSATDTVEGKDASGFATTARPVLVGMAGSASTFNLQTPLGVGDADNGNHTAAISPYVFNGSTNDRHYSMSGVGDGLGVALASQPSATYGTANATGATATVTFAAVAGQRHRLVSASVSYANGITAAAAGTVTDNATNLMQWLGTNQPTGPSLPEGGLKAVAVNTAMSVSLASGGVATVGWVLASKLTA